MCLTFSAQQHPAISLVVSIDVVGTWVLSPLVMSPGHLLQYVNGLQSYWWCSHCHLLVGKKVECRQALCQEGDPCIDGRVLVKVNNQSLLLTCSALDPVGVLRQLSYHSKRSSPWLMEFPRLSRWEHRVV